ncbi:hypothetical protein PHYPSEUDO_005528 [Phytophthora pseudosyringae]|uniref:Uncharacterized protein n=1 Tax=Phytophthora pseudosyringae TaxID=221518 RepID=A0A8T1WBZ4_9STRA|nr:hypothetical protein PHYPSEUDO_005528 [Phytophthora pseudosyringae]
MNRRSSTRTTKKQKQRKVTSGGSTAGYLSFVLELETASLFDYLSNVDMASLLQVCSSAFQQESVKTLSTKTMDRFALKTKTHLGRQCRCDGMRRFDGFGRDETCDGAAPFEQNKYLPILQSLEGTLDLLTALALAEKVLLLYCVDSGQGKDLFAPVVELLTEGSETFYTKEAVT